MASLKSFERKLRLAWQFSLSDWLLLIEAWWALLFFNLILRFVCYDRILPSAVETTADTSRTMSFVYHLQRLVGYASRLHLLPMTCLVRSLALQKMLSRRSIPAQVCIGVNKTLAEIHAHAWVEVNGEAVGEAQNVVESFTVLKSVDRIHS